MVDDLDDGREAAVVGAIVLDEDDAADHDEAPVGLSDGGFAHCDCGSAAGGLETEGRKSIVFGVGDDAPREVICGEVGCWDAGFWRILGWQCASRKKGFALRWPGGAEFTPRDSAPGWSWRAR